MAGSTEKKSATHGNGRNHFPELVAFSLNLEGWVGVCQMHNVTKDISRKESRAHWDADLRTWCLETGGWLDAGGDEGMAGSEFKMIFWGKITEELGHYSTRNREPVTGFISEGRMTWLNSVAWKVAWNVKRMETGTELGDKYNRWRSKLRKQQWRREGGQ